MLTIKAIMSSTRQAVVRSDSFTGLGYFPDLTPLRNDVLPIGINAGMLVLGLPTICQILKKPSGGSGNCLCGDGVMMYFLNHY